MAAEGLRLGHPTAIFVRENLSSDTTLKRPLAQGVVSTPFPWPKQVRQWGVLRSLQIESCGDSRMPVSQRTVLGKVHAGMFARIRLQFFNLPVLIHLTLSNWNTLQQLL